MRFLQRLERIVTTERVVWLLVVSVAAVVFFHLGQACSQPMEPYLPEEAASAAVVPEDSAPATTTEPAKPTESSTSLSKLPTSKLSTTREISHTSSEARITSSTTRSPVTTTRSNVGERGGLLNLNTATKEQLMVINGIGESFADRIIEYRESHGGFQSVEELRNISGIGEKRYNKWSAYFTVY